MKNLINYLSSMFTVAFLAMFIAAAIAFALMAYNSLVTTGKIEQAAFPAIFSFLLIMYFVARLIHIVQPESEKEEG